MNSKLPGKSIANINNQATSSHYQNKHLISQEEEPFYPPEKSLCVYPLPTTITRNELVSFLRRFGPVKRQQFRRKSFIIEYYDRKPVDILMSKTDWLQHEKLCLRRTTDEIKNYQDFRNKSEKTVPQKQIKNTKQNANELEENEDLISFDRTSHVIEDIQTFDKQLIALLNAIQLSNVEIMTRYNAVCPHLNEIFRSIFPECRTFRFGSTLTGLSFKGCDLDIYMYVGRKGLPPIFNDPYVSTDILTSLIFKKVRKLMYSLKYIFSNIVAIPRARTPIIKFHYLPTKVSCDITFKNGLGIYKSNFLRYCASRDVRIRPLILLIKYWARHLKLSGVGKISNYELVSLIIFYLQQVDLLPPLLELQKNCAPLIINGWQVNFDEHTILPPTSNNSTIPELLHNFFNFYSTFQFRQQIICLLDGKVHSTYDFDVGEIPDYMHRYKSIWHVGNKRLDTDKPMCVQDPIELNQNTAAVTPKRVLIIFQDCCKVSADICEDARDDNYKHLLGMLFTSAHPQLQTKQRKRKRMTFKTIIFAGKFLEVGLPEDFEQIEDHVVRHVYKENNWFYIVCNLIKDIFEMIFKFKVEMSDEYKIRVTDEQIKERDYIEFHCRGNKCVWKNRKKNNRTFLDVQLSALEKEVILSNKMLEQSNNDTNNITLNFMCLVQRSGELEVRKVNREQIFLSFYCDDGDDKETFRQFGCYALNFVPKVIEKTFIHMLQFKKTYSQLLHDKTQ